ncbi:MAG: tol-pal system protein YbgF [Bacteroidetes bacterium]|nr:tol-pal system protein YbgF [Bacteroidota bacterium]
MKKQISSFIPVILFLAALLVFISCATNKNSFENRAYHTVTSTYNVNFNGKEALKEGEIEIAKKRKDNYTSLLPLYYYPAKEDLGAINAKMDRVIEKASKSIYKHSMLIRGKEYVKTMDDAYMMMGKAYFHKQDFINASRIFTYIAKQYPTWGLAEEAIILNARTAIRQNQFTRAQQLLEEAYQIIYPQNKRKLNYLYYAALAELNMTNPAGEIEVAISSLIELQKLRPNKEMTIRINYILGQLYELENNNKEAQYYFLKVIKSTPTYDMEFSARMKLASNYDGTPTSKQLIIKELNKMLNESKNDEFKDQIYFAFSEIARIDEEKKERMEYLGKSVAAFVDNNFQRTFSSLTLADLYFQDSEYIKAQAYYDTALISLPGNYPNKDAIIKKASFLRDLVDNLNEISLQDSLQRIAKMSEGERNSWVKRMIDKYTEEERRIEREEAERMMLLQSTQNFANTNVNVGGNNKWYFYNPNLVTQGSTEFYRRFGNRKLEDNWIVSNKQQISFDEMKNTSAENDTVPEYDEEGNLIVKRETDPKKPAFYTQDLPMTTGAVDTSNLKIQNAMYNAALIYYDLLKDEARSVEMFDQLIKRFPNSELIAPACYLVYVNFKKTNNPKGDEYKNIILTRFPNSDYAKLIQDPDYYKKIADKVNELERKYSSAYDAYTKKLWQRTIQLADESIPICDNNKILQSKFEYIRAMSVGQVQGEDSLKKAFAKIIIKYPTTKVAELAQFYLSTFANANEIMANAGDSTKMRQIQEQNALNESPFTFLPNEQHYVVLIAKATSVSITDIKNGLANFNRDFFALSKFNINSFYINQEDQLITISRFKNMETAMEYYNTLITSEIYKTQIGGDAVQVYAMSATNYTTYYNKVDKRVLYQPFFDLKYIKKQ